MQNNSLIFTATYNESENIKTFLDIALKLNNIDILIIDDKFTRWNCEGNQRISKRL